MFRMQRSFEFRSGKGRQARQYLIDVSEYLRSAYSIQVQAFIEVAGPTHCSHLFMDFDDLASYERFWLQLGHDATFGELHEREADIVLEGTVRQALLHEAR